jgi:D-alanyl-D-alanine carboxypeptidase
MRTIAVVLAVPLVLVVLTVAGGHPAYKPVPADAEQARAQLREALAEYATQRPLVPGVALSVTAPGLTFVGAAGRSALLGPAAGAADPGHDAVDASGPPLSAEAPFRTASVTKTFTAAAVLRLVETGRLAVDDPLAVHLPHRLVQKVPGGDRITVRQLLNHTSGVYDYGTDPGWMARVAVSPGRVWRPLELVDHALTHGEPYAEPGEQWHYSDTGHVLLALILERVTGLPLADAYRALLPMDALPGTYLEGREPAPATAPPRAQQYAGPLPLGDHHPSYDNFGGGGLVSTVTDLDAFARALFEGRVFGDPATLGLMLETVPDGDGGAYGLGIGRRRIAGEDVWLHTGFSGSVVAYVPRLRLSIAASTGQALAPPDPLLAAVIRSSDVETHRPQLLARVLGDHVRRPRRREDELDVDGLDAGQGGEHQRALLVDDLGQRAAHAGEGHAHVDVPIALVQLVDQAEVDDVDPDLRVDDRLERFAQVVLRGHPVGLQVDVEAGALVFLCGPRSHVGTHDSSSSYTTSCWRAPWS